MSFGIGDGGGGPGEYHINMVKGARICVIFLMSKCPHPKAFLINSKRCIKLSRIQGRALFRKASRHIYHTGQSKKNNRECERLLHFAEWICTMAYMQGEAYPHKELEEIWKEVLLYQFHDILPGSSIHRVYEECNARYEILKTNLNSIIDEAVSYLSNDENAYLR